MERSSGGRSGGTTSIIFGGLAGFLISFVVYKLIVMCHKETFVQDEGYGCPPPIRSSVAVTLSKLYPYEPRNPLSGKVWPPGSPWPLPYDFSASPSRRLTFNPATFTIATQVLNDEKCDPLEFAVSKYNNDFLFPTIEGIVPLPDLTLPRVPELKVTVVGNGDGATECQNHPQYSDAPDNEHYSLTVEEGIAEIVAETVWGALSGLETFSQIIWSNENYELGSGLLHFYINYTTIEDFPRYPHRGLMIDSARHYLPERTFYQIMDAMTYNKLNTLHWHIVDDQSFPYVSIRFPELSQKGAYTNRQVYTQEMIARVIEAGRLRGIRIVLEFDTPGHTQSWGEAYPELLTPCYGTPGVPGTPNHPEHAAKENLDPTSNFTYSFMREFFTEIVGTVTKDQFVHLGMDEVYPPCWESSPEIAQFMRENNFTQISQVQEYYTERHIAMVRSVGGSPIIWQDPLDFGVNVDKEVLIQVWKNWGPDWQSNLQNVLDLGYKTILSAPWYINYIDYGEVWVNYYMADPVLSLPNITLEQQELIRGGEACIWGEFVDATNILPRLFPFISAVAERLWSHNIDISWGTAIDARGRLDQHRCRMLQRGIPAQPILNGYCGAWEAF